MIQDKIKIKQIRLYVTIHGENILVMVPVRYSEAQMLRSGSFHDLCFIILYLVMVFQVVVHIYVRLSTFKYIFIGTQGVSLNSDSFWS